MQYLAQPQMVQPVHQNPYSFQPQTSKPPQQPQNQPKDAFSDLFTLGKQLNYTTSDNYADPFSALPSDAKVHYVRPDETRDALLNKITFLENRIKELEGEIRDIDGQNNELRLLLSEHDSGLSSVRAQMEERMKIQQQQFLEANTQLKAHVENTYKKYEKDKLALITEMVESDRKFVEQILLKFENPNNLGNRGATAEDILQSSKNLQSNYEGILKILETGGSFGSGLRNLVTLASKLTDDAKGALSKITDPNLKMQIATGCRNVIKDIAQILSNSLSIASQPQGKAEPRQLDYLKEEQAKFLHNLSSINNAVMNAQSVLRRDPYATNLESIAEQELHAAVKILTEIANGLRSQNANRSSQPGTTLDVGKTIGKASESILQSLSLLVSFAASAQSERLKQELTGVSTQDLHRDPMWTEALVNASKGVINGAKALVTATGNCTSTKLDSASLKEAAKIISASTSQLVAASRAKNNGQSQTNLDQASESVIRATNELVEAANTLANAEQIEIMANSNSFVDAVKEEIDSQSLILKTEKELNLARIRLNQLKQARDHPQLLNLPETTSSPFTSTPSNTPTLNQVTPAPSNPTPVHVNPFL
uniref:I/LWEQ domain-containing protein n=1 Tax=Arcella intermedia TaxID=1963864 RepID=A0A6B2L0C2_9EUKA